MYRFIIYCSLPLFLLTNCASFVYLQDGRTLGEGNKTIQITSTSINLTEYNTFADFVEQEELFLLYDININLETAITDKIDVGIDNNLSFYSSLKIKWQFLGNQNSIFAGSIGAKGGTNFLLGFSGSFPINFQFPLFLSIHPTPKIAIYTVHTFLFNTYLNHASQSELDTDIEFQDTKKSMGNTIGILFGENHKVGLEITSLNFFYAPYLVSIGYRGKFKI